MQRGEEISVGHVMPTGRRLNIYSLPFKTEAANFSYAVKAGQLILPPMVEANIGALFPRPVTKRFFGAAPTISP